MKPYEYEQPGCDVQMTIGPNLAGDARLRILSGHPTVYIDVAPSEVPAAALALYEAAGLPEPLILENLPGNAETGDVAPFVTVDPSPAGSLQNLPGVLLDVDGSHVRLIRDEPLRVACALVSAMQQAAAQPDPAEVEALAGVLREHRGGLVENYRSTARAILLAGWERKTASARLRLPVRPASRRTRMGPATW